MQLTSCFTGRCSIFCQNEVDYGKIQFYDYFWTIGPYNNDGNFGTFGNPSVSARKLNPSTTIAD
jgi:hypothetical protein